MVKDWISAIYWMIIKHNCEACNLMVRSWNGCFIGMYDKSDEWLKEKHVGTELKDYIEQWAD